MDEDLDPRLCSSKGVVNSNICVAEGCFNYACCEAGWSPGAVKQWGVMFNDGSVSHPWNGRTQEQHARNTATALAKEYYPDNIRLVYRWLPNGPWQVAQD